MTKLMLSICIAGFILALGIMGNADYESEREIEAVHCENVAAGLYGDFKGVCDEPSN